MREGILRNPSAAREDQPKNSGRNFGKAEAVLGETQENLSAKECFGVLEVNSAGGDPV